MPEWLKMAQDAYESSTTYIDNNLRDQWEDAIRHFNGKHAKGSKYHKPSFTYRSKIFRPKTRASIRANEAAAMVAFFGNNDSVSIEPQNPDMPNMQATADIYRELLNYRLSETIPWFLTCIGAFQEAQKVGAVCAHIAWDYKEKRTKQDDIIDEYGQAIPTPDKVDIIKDEPFIELVPIENIRIDPGADWTDPVNTSPYFIQMIPMYVKDVKARMEDENVKTSEPKWAKLDDNVLASCVGNELDTTRSEREQQKEDRFDVETTQELKDYAIVWVHKNIISNKGKDYVYYTLSDKYLLSNPVLLSDIYLHGRRPYEIGVSVLTAHEVLPEGIAGIGRPMQKELNEMANARLDNVKMVLNKRWLVKRGAQVDVNSILRNAAGSVTMVNDVKEDVSAVEFHDVTGSSYQEQDRLNLDYDELVGTFSPSTIQTNRRMNETVGGMQMMRGGSQSLTEFTIRTFAETFVEPVLKQLLQLEAAYETDMVIMTMAAEKARIFTKYNVSEITDEMLNQNLLLKVNVGAGATDPQQRVQKLLFAFESLTKMAATPLPGLNMEEIQKEIFTSLGWKNANRFIFSSDSPQGQQMGLQMQSMQQQIQQLQQQAESKQAEQMVKMKVAKDREKAQDLRHRREMQTRIAEKVMDVSSDARKSQSNNR